MAPTLAALACFLLVGAFGLAVVNPANECPLIALSPTVDMGVLEPGGAREASFSFKNLSAMPVEVAAV